MRNNHCSIVGTCSIFILSSAGGHSEWLAHQVRSRPRHEEGEETNCVREEQEFREDGVLGACLGRARDKGPSVGAALKRKEKRAKPSPPSTDTTVRSLYEMRTQACGRRHLLAHCGQIPCLHSASGRQERRRQYFKRQQDLSTS
ncbi:unnamed protein product [Rangifer tarandus platyrhynchus]|uniref:Uncharacterized protein n=1 Tax=Rangifer tarandus platyrhynchus TaxID=3082113 RepID=A0AC59Z162_RANTA